MKCDTLVLVPGLLCDHRMWEHQIIGLTNHMRVMVADTGGDDTIAGMAEGILDMVEGDFAIAGLSMGGYVTLEVLASAPERVSHFALMDTNAHADLAEATQKRHQGIKLAQAGKFDEVIDLFIDSILGARAKKSILTQNIIRSMAKDFGVEVFVRQQTAIINRADQMAKLKNYPQPSLVLCGRDDALTPPAAHREMAALLSNADYQELADCGHMSAIERPQQAMIALLSLLRR